MQNNLVRTRRSADQFPKSEHLAWKIAEIATDPVAVDAEVEEMIVNRIIDNAAVSAASVTRRPVANARAQAQAIKDDMLASAKAESERIAATGRAQLESQRAQIVAELRQDLGRVSVYLASKVVGESLTDDALKRRTVERFLADLER